MIAYFYEPGNTGTWIHLNAVSYKGVVSDKASVHYVAIITYVCDFISWFVYNREFSYDCIITYVHSTIVTRFHAFPIWFSNYHLIDKMRFL